MPAITSRRPASCAIWMASEAPLSSVDAAKEEQVVARLLPVGELVEVDTVIHVCDVVEVGRAIGVADGDVVTLPVVFAIDGEYAGRGEAVDGRHHRAWS